jgi:hypothetical protein
MKKQLLTIALLLLGISAVLAQSKDVETLEQSVEELKHLLINPERAGLEAITSKDLSYGHSNGKIEDQNAFVEFLLSGKSQFVNIELEDQTVKVVDNTGIVRHTLLAETNNEGTIGNIKLGVLSVWHKDGEKWILLARQAFKL